VRASSRVWVRGGANGMCRNMRSDALVNEPGAVVIARRLRARRTRSPAACARASRRTLRLRLRPASQPPSTLSLANPPALAPAAVPAARACTRRRNCRPRSLTPTGPVPAARARVRHLHPFDRGRRPCRACPTAAAARARSTAPALSTALAARPGRAAPATLCLPAALCTSVVRRARGARQCACAACAVRGSGRTGRAAAGRSSALSFAITPCII
jgi:hypothetical protein